MKNILAKILKIMEAVDAVPKRGYNAAQNYKFVMGNDVDEHVRKALVQNKLALITSVKEVKVVPATVPMVNDKLIGDMTYVLIEFTLTDIESGETIVSEYWGTGKDSGDKAIYKAYTGAVKYFWLKTLMIPSELTDPEIDDEPVKVKSSANINTGYFGKK